MTCFSGGLGNVGYSVVIDLVRFFPIQMILCLRHFHRKTCNTLPILTSSSKGHFQASQNMRWEVSGAAEQHPPYPAGRISCAGTLLQLPFHFLGSIEAEVSRVKVDSDQVLLPVLAALELLCTAFYQTPVLESRDKRCHWKKQAVSQLGRHVSKLVSSSSCAHCILHPGQGLVSALSLY